MVATGDKLVEPPKFTEMFNRHAGIQKILMTFEGDHASGREAPEIEKALNFLKSLDMNATHK